MCVCVVCAGACAVTSLNTSISQRDCIARSCTYALRVWHRHKKVHRRSYAHSYIHSSGTSASSLTNFNSLIDPCLWLPVNACAAVRYESLLSSPPLPFLQPAFGTGAFALSSTPGNFFKLHATLRWCQRLARARVCVCVYTSALVLHMRTHPKQPR